jgi:hypothetical protein
LDKPFPKHVDESVQNSTVIAYRRPDDDTQVLKTCKTKHGVSFDDVLANDAINLKNITKRRCQIGPMTNNFTIDVYILVGKITNRRATVGISEEIRTPGTSVTAAAVLLGVTVPIYFA